MCCPWGGGTFLSGCSISQGAGFFDFFHDHVVDEVGFFDVDVCDSGGVEADVRGSQVDVEQWCFWVFDGCGYAPPERDGVGSGVAFVDAVDAFDVRGDRGRGDRVGEYEEVDGDVGVLEVLGDADLVVCAPGVAEEDEGFLDGSFVVFLDDPFTEPHPFFVGDGGAWRSDGFVDFVSEGVHACGEDTEPAAHAVDVACSEVVWRVGFDGSFERSASSAGDVHAAAEAGYEDQEGGGENCFQYVLHFHFCKARISIISERSILGTYPT